MKAKLFLVCGFPGSGKTRFAKMFAEQNDFAYLCIDDCYTEINGDELDHSNKFKVWQRFYYLINEYQENEVDVVVEAMSLDKYARHEFISWFPNFSHHLIVMTNDFEECCANVAKRRRNISREGMLKLKDRFRLPDRNEREEWNSGIMALFDEERLVCTTLVNTKDDFNKSLLKGVVWL